jgi:hypothetical protein
MRAWQAAVEADCLTVQHGVLDDGGEPGEIPRPTDTARLT